MDIYKNEISGELSVLTPFLTWGFGWASSEDGGHVHLEMHPNSADIIHRLYLSVFFLNK